MSRQKLGSNQKVIILGCGAVGKCCLHYLDHFFDVDYEKVYVIDKDSDAFLFPTVKHMRSRGVNVLHYNITRKNIEELLDSILQVNKHDIIIDVTTETPTYIIFKECRLRNLLYINTSIEDDEMIDMKLEKLCPTNEGIFLQHVNIQAIAQKTEDDDHTTSVIEFGMNPGLISVFVKQGIMDLAKMVIENNKRYGKLLKQHYKKKDHRRLAELLKIRTIHCSEIDTQVPKKMPDAFVNTWSCVGLLTEGLEAAEIQIGTHEKVLPFSAKNVSQILPQLILTKKNGQDIKVKSVVPLRVRKDNTVEFTNIVGRCIHHGEGISLNRYLGTFRYSPTMHYAYQLNPVTEKMMNYYSKDTLVKIMKDPKSWKVLNMYEDEINGYDNVGALFMMDIHPITGDRSKPFCFWTGSVLSTNYTTKVLRDPYFGPTIIQVMAGILSGVSWMVENKHKGVLFGEDLDDNYIIKKCKKYLGLYYSGVVSDEVSLPGTKIVDLIVEGGDDPSEYVDVRNI